jgi:hypothetical protein
VLSPRGFDVAERLTEAGVVALAVASWAVLAYVIFVLPVSPGTQVVLIAAGFVALSCSTALVCGLYVSRAMARGGDLRAAAAIGTGMRFALIVEVGLWLQSLRVLTAGYAVLLVGAFIFLEFLARQARDSEHS